MYYQQSRNTISHVADLKTNLFLSFNQLNKYFSKAVTA